MLQHCGFGATAAALVIAAVSRLVSATGTFLINNLPQTSEKGQSGTNKCGTVNSPTAMCQTIYMNSINDFCFYAPPNPGSTVGDTEEKQVAYCLRDGYGTRTVPPGTFTAAHWLQTPHYIQITGTGDFTKVNVQAGDEGGELDPHGATGEGNPIGALVYANGTEVFEWHEFLSDTEFCIRVCLTSDPDANRRWCPHIYDLMGCQWNDPGDYSPGFTDCDGDDSSLPSGVYKNGTNIHTFHQGDAFTPDAPAAGASSNCQILTALNGGGGSGGILTSPTNLTTAPRTSTSASMTSTSPPAPAATAAPAPGTNTPPANNGGSTSAASSLVSSAHLLAIAGLLPLLFIW